MHLSDHAEILPRHKPETKQLVYDSCGYMHFMASLHMHRSKQRPKKVNRSSRTGTHQAEACSSSNSVPHPSSSTKTAVEFSRCSLRPSGQAGGTPCLKPCCCSTNTLLSALLCNKYTAAVGSLPQFLRKQGNVVRTCMSSQKRSKEVGC